MTCTQPNRPNKYWKIHEHTELQHTVNTHHTIENCISPAKSMGLWRSCCPLLQLHGQLTAALPFCKELPICSWIYPWINASALPWPWKQGKLLSALCTIIVGSWAVTGEEQTSQKLVQIYLRPTSSCSHRLELLQYPCGHKFSSLDPPEIVLVAWNISEDFRNSQKWYLLPISRTFPDKPQFVDPWWFITHLIFPPSAYNCESSH